MYIARCLAAGLFFSYAILIRNSGLNWWAAMVLLNGGAFFVSLVIATAVWIAQGQQSISAFLIRPDVLAPGTVVVSIVALGCLLGFLSGMSNGIGHAFYQPILAGKMDISSIGIAIPISCVVFGVLSGVLLNGERFTRDKAIALTLALWAMWFAK